MGDSFDPRRCDAYIEFFSRVIESARAQPAAAAVDERLRRFGLRTAQDFVARANRVRKLRRTPPSCRPASILVLSRVTLGADVAVTSVVLDGMMRRFPEARVVLLGGRKSALLFAGESRVEARTVDYPRGGGLLERLSSWLALVDVVEAEASRGDFLVVDPDSRLTQLGMLPVTADESGYYFFESRSFTRPGKETLAGLTEIGRAHV